MFFVIVEDSSGFFGCGDMTMLSQPIIIDFESIFVNNWLNRSSPLRHMISLNHDDD